MRCTPVLDFPEHAKLFVEQGLWNGTRTFGPSTAIGFANEQEGFVAAFVFHDYEPEKGVIEISGYSTHRAWCSKQNLKMLFDYPFEQLGARAIVARHSEHNKPVRRIWKALGADEYVIPELWGGGEAMALAVLLKKRWLQSRFMRNRNEQT